MCRELAATKLVKASLTDLLETAVPVASDITRADDTDRLARRRRHRWLLILAFEVLVFGCAQSVLHPIQAPGVVVEQAVAPNHVVT